jgi:hypothetical protein
MRYLLLRCIGTEVQNPLPFPSEMPLILQVLLVILLPFQKEMFLDPIESQGKDGVSSTFSD